VCIESVATDPCQVQRCIRFYSRSSKILDYACWNIESGVREFPRLVSCGDVQRFDQTHSIGMLTRGTSDGTPARASGARARALVENLIVRADAKLAR